MTRTKTGVVALVIALAVVAALAGISLRPGTASADGIAGVTCAVNPAGLSDCTISLGTYIAPGGSLIGTLTAATGSIVSCNTIPAGGVCSVTPATVSFYCPAGCAAGNAYHDVVQYSNVAAAQTFTATGGSTCLVGVYGLQTCGYQTGYTVAGQCISSLGYTFANACGTQSLVNGCLSSGTVAVANLCTSGFYTGTGCSALTANGVLLNRCGVGVNCIGTVYTTHGLIERNIC